MPASSRRSRARPTRTSPQLRRFFLEKAVVAGQDRVARPLVDAGVGPDELAELTLGSAPASPALDRLRERRAALGLPDDDGAPLLIHPDGSRVSSAQVPLHLRRARLTRLGIETNGEFCKSFLKTRYAQHRRHRVSPQSGRATSTRKRLISR